jgi:hypothetical protein
MRRLAALLAVLWLALPAPAHANPLCRWVGVCLYFSPGFELTVVDAETGTPLPGVYAWAEWVQYGAHGTGGPLVVQDAFSDAAGRLTFPRWGPTRGSRGGLLLGTDPAVILFKSGYATKLIENGVALGASHHAAIRGFSRHGETVRLQAFRGSALDRVEHVHKLAYPALHAYVPESHRAAFAPVYLRRIDVAVQDLRTLPSGTPKASDLLWVLERSRGFFRGDAP